MALIGSLVIGISARTSDLERGLNRARQQVNTFAGQMRKTANQVQALFNIPALLGGLAVGAGLTRAVGVIADFEQKLSDVRAVTQATEEQMASLAAEARRLGATTQFSAAQAAEGMVMLGQAGFSTDQILKAMNATLNLAAAGSLELAQAAEIVSNILSTFNLNASETRRVTDVLAAAAAISNTNVQQLGEAFSYAGPIAAGFGKSIETTAAALAVLSNRGIQASRAGEGLRRVLGVLADPTKEVRDTLKALQTVFPQLQISMEQLNPQTNDIATIFARLSPLLADTRIAFRLFGVEGAGIAQILAQNVTQLQQYEARVQSSGQASEQARVRVDNLRGDFKELLSAVEEVALQLGEQGLLGALRNATQTFTALIRESYSLRVALQAIGKTLDLVIRGISSFALGLEFALSQAVRSAVYYGGQIQTALVRIIPIAGQVFGTLEENLKNQEARLKENQKAWQDYQKNLGNALGMNEDINKAMREANAAMAQDPFVAQQGIKPPPEVPRIDLKGQEDAISRLLQESGGSGTRLATMDDIKKQVEDLQKALDALQRQAGMGIPGFDLAAERVKTLETGVRAITDVLALHPLLAADLPPELQKAVEGFKAQLGAAQRLVDTQEQARDAARELAQDQERRAKQAAELVRQLGLEAQMIQQQLGLQKLSTSQQDVKTRLLEFEMQLQEQGLQLSATQRQQAEQYLTIISRTRQEMEALQQAQADEQRRGDTQRRIMTDMAHELNLTQQLLDIQRLSTEQRTIANMVLEREAELIANGIEVTAERRAGLEQLATAQVRLNAALDKATFFRDLSEDIADLRALVAAQRLSRREREIEIALIQEKRRLNRALAPEEEAQLRQQLALQRDLNDELNRPRPLRDFAESTQDFFLGIEESAVRALEGLEEALVRFAETGSFRSPEAEQTLADLRGVAIERRALMREMEMLRSLPSDQPVGEALRQKERLNNLQREVDILDERKRVLDETAKSQTMLNKLFTEFYNQLLQASVRMLVTGPLAGQGAAFSQGQQGGGSGWTQLLMQGLNLVAGLWGGGTATAGQAASAVEGFRQAGYTQGIVSHRGGLVGRDAFPRIALPTKTWASAARFATGGMVMSRGGDNVPALLQSGERVLSRQETARLAQLEQAVQLARNARHGEETPQSGHTFNLIFPNVTTRQDADALRRSASQVQNQIITAVERSRARSNIPSPAR